MGTRVTEGGLLVSVTGDRKLDRKLRQLRQSVQTKVVKASIRSGCSVGAKEVKAAIPSGWKDARKGVGWSFKKDKKRGNMMTAKIGVAVGQKKAKLEAWGDKVKTRRKAQGKKGVGMGANTLHWAIVGTYRWHNPPLATLVSGAMSSGSSKINAAVTKKLHEGIMREAAKG